MNYADMMDSEKEVADFLDTLGLPWIFQSPIFVYDERKRPRVWTPDFYIPTLGVYIEVCGSPDFNYEYRKKIYVDNSVSVIYVHTYKSEGKWRKFLLKRMKEVEEYRHSQALKLFESIDKDYAAFIEF